MAASGREATFTTIKMVVFERLLCAQERTISANAVSFAHYCTGLTNPASPSNNANHDVIFCVYRSGKRTPEKGLAETGIAVPG